MKKGMKQKRSDSDMAQRGSVTTRDSCDGVLPCAKRPSPSSHIVTRTSHGTRSQRGIILASIAVWGQNGSLLGAPPPNTPGERR